MRFVIEVTREVKKVVGENKSLLVRISATDWAEGGWDIESSIELAKELKLAGVDLIHVSSGGLIPHAKIPVAPNYQVEFATRIKNEAQIPTCAVGLITDANQANDIVARGDADLIALARAVLYNPRWVWSAAAELDGRVQASRQYWRCLPKEAAHIFESSSNAQR